MSLTLLKKSFKKICTRVISAKISRTHVLYSIAPSLVHFPSSGLSITRRPNAMGSVVHIPGKDGLKVKET